MKYLIRYNENLNEDSGWANDEEGFYKTFNFTNYADALDFIKDVSLFTKIPKVVMLETNVTIWVVDDGVLREIDEMSKTQIALTKSEQKILDLTKAGKTYKEMSEELGTSVNTINFHLKNIYRKLGINSKMELVSGRYKRK